MCGMSGQGKLAAFLSGFWFAINAKWSSRVSMGVGGRVKCALGGREGGDSCTVHHSRGQPKPGPAPAALPGYTHSLLYRHKRLEPKAGARSPSWLALEANTSHLRWGDSTGQ